LGLEMWGRIVPELPPQLYSFRGNQVRLKCNILVAPFPECAAYFSGPKVFSLFLKDVLDGHPSPSPRRLLTRGRFLPLVVGRGPRINRTPFYLYNYIFKTVYPHNPILCRIKSKSIDPRGSTLIRARSALDPPLSTGPEIILICCLPSGSFRETRRRDA
jgi:hypothetical protein